MLKKHFIPKESNNHRPHILRKQSIQQILILIIVFELLAIAGAGLMKFDGRFGTASVVPLVLSDLTNKERKDQNLGALSVNETLNQAAQLKAEDMATKGYFAHTSPEGKTPWYWLKQVGYNYQYAGENLAVDFSDSQDVAHAWMGSPTHKANIIKQNYTEVGTGVAEGVFEGKKTIFVAQVYANPVITNTVPVAAPVIVAPTPVAVVQNPTPVVTIPAVAGVQDPQVQESPDAYNSGKVPEESTKALTVGHNNTSALVAVVDNKITTQVLGAEISPTPLVVTDVPTSSNFFQRVAASPRSHVNVLLVLIIAIMGSALMVYLGIKRRDYQFDLITNGLTVIAVAGGIFMVNYLTSIQSTVVIQSIDYSVTETQS